MTIDDLKIGDEFYAPQTRYRAPLRGKITKINRVNFTYETHYCPAPGVDELMILTNRKVELIDGFVFRNGKKIEVKLVAITAFCDTCHKAYAGPGNLQPDDSIDCNECYKLGDPAFRAATDRLGNPL